MANERQLRVYSVSEITRGIKVTLEDAFGCVWIEGEISGARQYGSGHTYFSLKDSGAQISAVLFAGSARTAGNVEIKDGQLVRVYGRMTVYETRGTYQIVVSKIQLAGVGALMARFEELKSKLAAEGLFDEARKRPVPGFPRRIGIVTSRDGAAVRDVLSTLDRRFPDLHIVIAPTRVQGAGAEREIAAAIDLLNAYGGPDRPSESPCPPLDVLIVTRGGGSLEDLWCFNEEVVARAVARSKIPVISAVGHEIDFSLCDFASDKRAATPTAAAEIVIKPKVDFIAMIGNCEARLVNATRKSVALLRGRVDAARVNRVFSEPGHAVENLAQRVDMLDGRLRAALGNRMNSLRRRFDAAASRVTSRQAAQVPAIRARITALDTRMRQAVNTAKEKAARRLTGASVHLQAINPLAVLDRGYSLTRLEDGSLLTDPAQVAPGARLVTRLAKGEVKSVVEGRFAGKASPHRRRNSTSDDSGWLLPGFD